MQIEQQVEKKEEKTNTELMEKAQESVAPEDMAARLYGTLLPQFDAQIKALSKKGLRRVLELLVKAPLEDVNFRMTDKLEQNVYILSNRMVEAKFIMITSVMNEQLAKASEEQVEGEEASEEIKQEEKGE